MPGLSSFASGKEDHPSLVRPMSSFDQEPVFEGTPQAKPTDKKPTAVPAVLPAAVKRMEAAQPATVPVVPTTLQPLQSVPKQPVPAVAATAPSPADMSLTPTPAPPPRSLLQIAAPSSATVGQQFSLDIKVSDVNDLANAPFVLTYDPVFVDFVSVSEGLFLKKDGKPTTFNSKTDSAAGTLAVTLGRTPGNGGVAGSGILATVTFRAKNQGPASFAFRNAVFTSSYSAALNVLPFSTAVDIR